MFVFDRADLDVAANVRRAAREEFDQAIAEVSETGFEVHGTVRNVRRRLKRIRSLLRLIRPIFPDYAAENAALRGIGADIAQLRDLQALVEAVDLLGRKPSADVAVALIRLRAQFRGRADEHEAALDRETFLFELRGQLREARVRSELWELNARRPRSLVPGIVETYRQARSAFRAARATESDAALHEWRKRLKYHASHLKLLRNLVPAFADGRRRAAGGLAGTLGDFQNLSILLDHLEVAGEDRPLIEDEARRRQKRLRKKSLKAGAVLFAERPKALHRRWQVYCEDWAAAERLGRRGG